MIVFLICLQHTAIAQTLLTKLEVNPQMRDTFSFTKHWDYAWDILKDEHTKKLYRMDGKRLQKNDTTHNYYTANCSTNVQGGYNIRYCYAEKRNDNLVLNFSDGLPAYASEYYVYIVGDSFYFKPQMAYPSFLEGEKFSYKTLQQKLVLNKNIFNKKDILTGCINVVFTEKYEAPGKQTQTTELYLKGFIHTKVL